MQELEISELCSKAQVLKGFLKSTPKTSQREGAKAWLVLVSLSGSVTVAAGRWLVHWVQLTKFIRLKGMSLT